MHLISKGNPVVKRKLLNVNKDFTVVNYMRPYEGGTGGKTAVDARLILDIAPSTIAGASLGVAVMPATGLTPLQFEGVGMGANTVSLRGPTIIPAGMPTSFQITDYDMALVYSVSAINAIVRQAQDTVIVTPNDMVDSVLLSINGRLFSLNVEAPRAKAPVITAPISNSPSITTSFIATITPFIGADATDLHESTQWEIATDLGFSTIVTYSHDNTSHITQWPVNSLSLNSYYYLRARVKGSKFGYSAWSTTTFFKTKTTTAAVSESAKLALYNSSINDRLGESVALSADGFTCVVGVPGRLSSRGQAIVYNKRGSVWVHMSTLSALDGSAGDRFGSCVSISQDANTIVVGAPSDNRNTGSCYVFTKKDESYTFLERLVSDDAQEGDYYASSVAIAGDGKTFAVGAPRKEASTGAVYVCRISSAGITLFTKLVSTVGFSGALFGHSLSMTTDGTRLAISSPGDKDKGVNAGACFVYLKNDSGYTLESKLIDSNGSSNDFLAYGLSISGDGGSILLGSYQDDDGGTNSGSVVYYTRTGTRWSQISRLTANDAAASDLFGFSVSMSTDGNVAVVGAYGDNPQGDMSGSSYVFKRTGITWVLQAKVFPSDTKRGDRFGSSCSISQDGTYCAIGAPSSDTGAESTGAVYIFV